MTYEDLLEPACYISCFKPGNDEKYVLFLFSFVFYIFYWSYWHVVLSTESNSFLKQILSNRILYIFL